MRANAIRPSPLLVRLFALTALGAVVSLPLPWLTAPTIAVAVIIALLSALDWLMSRRDPAPRVERTFPPRLVKD